MALLGLIVTGCSSSHAAAGSHHAGTTTPTAAQVSASGSSTTSGAGFPALVVAAMAEFNPVAAGAQAPHTLPQVSGYLTAETSGLGGQDNVTLIATATPVPVDSPSLSSSSAGREVASFSTTPTASAANAQSQMAQARGQAIASCGGPSHPVTLSGGVAATTCPTLDGAAIDWSDGAWAVQVLTLDGTTPSTAEADTLAARLAGDGLPTSDGGGIVTAVVPGNPSAGSSDTAALEWAKGADVYQVRSSDDPTSALAVAAAMRPYPG